MKPPLQCFMPSKAVWTAMSPDEVDATWEAMVELNLAKPPCAEFDLVWPAYFELTPAEDAPRQMREKGTISLLVGDEAQMAVEVADPQNCPRAVTISFRYRDGAPLDLAVNFFHSKEQIWLGSRYGVSLPPHIRELMETSYKRLLVLLATKNATKTTEENKLAKLGIGKKAKSYRYITRIDIGAITENHESVSGTGRKVRPHLRRGHIRNQRYGPGFQFVKQIFIEPLLVHADEEFVAAREAYYLSL